MGYYINQLILERSTLMVRIAKQAERRARFPRKTKAPAKKTGPLKQTAYVNHVNAVEGDLAKAFFIPKIK